MAPKKLLLGFFLCLLDTTALATSEKCNLENFTVPQPTQRFEYEGGYIETWDINEEQFRCARVTPLRRLIQPNVLAVPSYHPFPRLVYVERGQGVVGVQFPGCAETFDAGFRQPSGTLRDSQQQVYRYKKGDLIVIPGGAVHWGYNDGDDDAVTIGVNFLDHPANQLDFQSREFFMAGEQQLPGKESTNFFNIFAGFTKDMLTEALDINPEIVKAMQKPAHNRGILVKFTQPMDPVTPDEPFQEQESSNNVGNSICTTKITFDLDNPREADVVSRQAGRLIYADENKLPILSQYDFSAEKGRLLPNALLSPHYSTNSHTIVYVLNGTARFQTISNTGVTAFNKHVKPGDFFAIPQNFASMAKAGPNGFEWVGFKTSKSPSRRPLAGYTSAFRALPLQVITNALEISTSQAQELKASRGSESILLSPVKTNQSEVFDA